MNPLPTALPDIRKSLNRCNGEQRSLVYAIAYEKALKFIKNHFSKTRMAQWLQPLAQKHFGGVGSNPDGVLSLTD